MQPEKIVIKYLKLGATTTAYSLYRIRLLTLFIVPFWLTTVAICTCLLYDSFKKYDSLDDHQSALARERELLTLNLNNYNATSYLSDNVSKLEKDLIQARKEMIFNLIVSPLILLSVFFIPIIFLRLQKWINEVKT
ncbi:hypothetical protein [Niabella hirudinis]|uniref:hypothetical protein n=1 Tax=Niabella hirudinis TaxID=1285929 RepID=UPI003EC11248